MKSLSASTRGDPELLTTSGPPSGTGRGAHGWLRLDVHHVPRDDVADGRGPELTVGLVHPVRVDVAVQVPRGAQRLDHSVQRRDSEVARIGLIVAEAQRWCVGEEDVDVLVAGLPKQLTRTLVVLDL